MKSAWATKQIQLKNKQTRKQNDAEKRIELFHELNKIKKYYSGINPGPVNEVA